MKHMAFKNGAYKVYRVEYYGSWKQLRSHGKQYFFQAWRIMDYNIILNILLVYKTMEMSL